VTEARATGHSAAVPSASQALASPLPQLRRIVEPLSAFDAVYAQHFESVWRSLRRLGVAEPSVDDAAQEVFLIVHRRLGGFERRSSERTWVLGIALRVAADFRRKQRRKADPTEPLNEALVDQRPGPHESAANAQALQQVDQILAELGDEKREAFVLAEIEGLSAPEISEAIGVNLNTVYSRIRAARRAFDDALTRRHGDQP
jgi:RNA polymerase sigma-70 factor, ECF subfamily